MVMHALRPCAGRGIVAAGMTGGQGAAMAGNAGDDGRADRHGAAGGPAAPKPRDARAERLAAQLKANLKRRREQARGRAANEDEG